MHRKVPVRFGPGAARKRACTTGTSPAAYRCYYVLEAAGLAVQLVNPAQARQLPGPAQDRQAGREWLARLTEMGLLRPSFVPPPAIRALRDYTRARIRLVHERTRCCQRLEKLLEGALIKLSVGGQQADHRIGQGHGEGADRRGTRPAGAGRPGPHPDESQARRRWSRPWPACSAPTTASSPGCNWTRSPSWTPRSPSWRPGSASGRRDPRRLGHGRRRHHRPRRRHRPGRRGAARGGPASGDPRRQPGPGPRRSSPRPAWT